MLDLDGPELLQFAMMFVQGAMKKSQVCIQIKNVTVSPITIGTVTSTISSLAS